MRSLVLLCLGFLAHCNQDALPGAMVDGGVDARALDAAREGCAQPEPVCAHGCGSDWIAQPSCVSGRWRCPPDTVDATSCPPGTCWGPPTAGEVCGPGGWMCKPDERDYQLCPEFMCPECDGFAGPTDVMGCLCECSSDGTVRCARR